jgi:hypothetical protein
MIRMRFSHCVVIVAIIVVAEPLVADVAENEEGRADHRDAALAREIQNIVSKDGRDENESDSDEPVCENAQIPVRTTAQAKGDQAGWEDEPEQNGVKAGVAQYRGCQDRESDNCNRDNEAMYRARG